MYNEFEVARAARKKLVLFADDGSISEVKHFEGERGKEYMVKSEVYNQYDPYVVHYLETTKGAGLPIQCISGRELQWGDRAGAS